MKITQAQRTVRDVAPSMAKMQGMNVSTNAAMFGGNTQGLESLAKGLSTFANTGTQIVNDIRNTDAREAANKMQQNFMQFQTEAVKKKGKNGLNVGEEYNTWQKAQYDELTKDMDSITRARFQSIADMQGASYARWSENYAYGEKVTYEVSTQQAVLDSNIDMLVNNIADPELAQQSIDQTIAASNRIAELKGLGAEATLQLQKDSVSKALVPAISATIQSGQVGSARGMIQHYENMLGGVNVKNLTTLANNESKRQQAEARARAREAEALRKEAEQKAEQEEIRNFVNSTRDTLSSYDTVSEMTVDGVALIDDIYKDNPEMRDKVFSAFMNEIKYQENVENAQAMRETLDYQKATVGMSPMEKAEYLNSKSISKTGLNMINEYQNEAYETETVENTKATNNLYNAIDNAIDSKRPLTETELYSMIATNALTSKQADNVISYYRDGGVEGKVTQSQLNNAYKYIYPDKSSSDMKADFRDFIIKELPSGRAATQAEINEKATLFIMQGSTEGSGIFSDSESYIEAVENNRLDTWLPDIDDDEIPYIDEQLRSNGMKISDSNRKLYKKRFMLGLE